VLYLLAKRLFIFSDQLSKTHAGFVAHTIGAVPAVVIGGFGTIAVAAIWAWTFPGLRTARKLEKAG
jgi:hypothetical protein